MLHWMMWMAGLTLWSLFQVKGASPTTPGTELVNTAKAVEQRVSKLRGLAVKKEIRWEVATKDTVHAYLLKALEQQYPPGELEKEGDALKALGLIPGQLNYRSFIIKLYEEQVGGFYDPKKELFYLAGWIPAGIQSVIIAHELTHALQDQHFNIDQFAERQQGNSDALYARLALLEGDATWVMLLDSMGSTGIDLDLSAIDLDSALGRMMMSLSTTQMPTFDQAPRAVRELLMFPYMRGFQFVGYGRKLGGWKRIDAVYADLPTSTEQILHPQRYFEQRDAPEVVFFTPPEELRARKWEWIYEDVLGEFMLLQLLEPIFNEEERRKAADGWDGDKVIVWRRGKELAWVLSTVWDSDQDAVEFAGAYAKMVGKRGAGFSLQPLNGQPQMAWKNAENRVIWVEKRGSRVLVTENLEKDLAESVRQAAFH